MRSFFKSNKFKAALCILASLLAGVLLSAFLNSGSSPLTSVASVIYTPFQKIATHIAEKTENIKGSFASSSSYKAKVEELESAVIDYSDKLVDYERTKQKLASYEEFLKVREANPDYDFVSATIVSRNTADAYDSFTINVGTTDGVKVNSPVIYGNNVVGIVKQAGLTASVVKTILDPSVNISVYEIKSRENGYSNTNAALSYDGLCRISGLTRDTAVAAGGIVCTSGLGGIFPRDLVVGTVTQIKNEESDVSLYGIIRPNVDVRALNDVFVITGFAPLEAETQ